jgi:hypothetical protein
VRPGRVVDVRPERKSIIDALPIAFGRLALWRISSPFGGTGGAM